MLTGIPQFVLVLILGVIGMALLVRGFNKLERKFLWYGFGAHVVGTVALVSVVEFVFGGGDMWTYQQWAKIIARRVASAPNTYGPALLELIVGRKPPEFAFVFGAGNSTGVMSGITGAFASIWGDSFLGTSLALSLFAFVGQAGFYLAFKANLPQRYHKRALIAALLVPSVVFWTSGVVKEAVAMGGLGVAIYGLSLLVNRSRVPRAIAALVVGGAVVGVIKSYILFPLAIAGAIWFFMNLSVRRGKPFKIKAWHMIVGGVAAMLAIAALGSVFSQYRLGNVAEQTADLQGQYRKMKSAGSTYELGDPSARTLTGQLRYAPLALGSALFRPFFFEVRNVAVLMNAVETTALLLLVLYLLATNGVKRLFRRATSAPFLVFLIVFVLLFLTAVGLAAPNLGTLSRYRVPCFPAYWLLLLVLLPLRDRQKPIRRPSTRPQ